MEVILANATKILILIMIYTVMARSRPTILSQMRLGQQFKVHANIALLLEKKGNSMHFWAQIGLAKLI